LCVLTYGECLAVRRAACMKQAGVVTSISRNKNARAVNDLPARRVSLATHTIRPFGINRDYLAAACPDSPKGGEIKRFVVLLKDDFFRIGSQRLVPFSRCPGVAESSLLRPF
jgi:hypothetical protein